MHWTYGHKRDQKKKVTEPCYWETQLHRRDSFLKLKIVHSNITLQVSAFACRSSQELVSGRVREMLQERLHLNYDCILKDVYEFARTEESQKGRRKVFNQKLYKVTYTKNTLEPYVVSRESRYPYIADAVCVDWKGDMTRPVSQRRASGSQLSILCPRYLCANRKCYDIQNFSNTPFPTSSLFTYLDPCIFNPDWINSPIFCLMHIQHYRGMGKSQTCTAGFFPGISSGMCPSFSGPCRERTPYSYSDLNIYSVHVDTF